MHRPVIDRRAKLLRLIAEQEVESVAAVAEYRPATNARIDDLETSSANILSNLHGVEHVDILCKAEIPTSRIIHICYWHRVPKDLFTIDLARAYAGLTPAEINLLYKQHLFELELVQIQQIALPSGLIQHHDLKRVFAEGLTPDDVSNYRERIAVLQCM